MGFIGGLHAAAEVLEVKTHDVIQAIYPPEPGVQLIPPHLHLLPAPAPGNSTTVITNCQRGRGMHSHCTMVLYFDTTMHNSWRVGVNQSSFAL